MKYLFLSFIIFLLYSPIYSENNENTPLKYYLSGSTNTDELFLSAMFSLNSQNDFNLTEKILTKILTINKNFNIARTLLADIKMIQADQKQAFKLYWENAQKESDDALYCLDVIYPDIELNTKMEKFGINALTKIYNETKNPFLKTNASYNLGFIYDEKNNKKANEFFKNTYSIKDWMYIGPFNNKEKTGFNEVYGPEKEIDLNKSYKGKVVDVKWRKLPVFPKTGIIDLSKITYPNIWACCYLYTNFYSDIEIKGAFRFGVCDAAKIWLNNECIHENDQYIGFIPDQYNVPVIIKKGWNTLLVKICQKDMGWYFFSRFTDKLGNPLKNLTFNSSLKGFIKNKGEIAKHKIKIPIDNFCNKIKEKFPIYSDYIKARRYQQNKFYNKAVKLYEKLLKKYPDSSIFLYNYANCLMEKEKPTSALTNLKKALKNYNNNILAKLDIGIYYYSSRIYDKAIEKFTEIKRSNPDLIENILYLIRTYNKKLWPLESFLLCSEYVHKYPYNSDLLLEFSIKNYFFRNNIKASLEYFQKLLKLKHSSYYIWNYYIYFIKSTSSLSKISEAIKNAEKIFPDDINILLEKANNELLLQNYKNVKEYLEKAKFISPYDYRPYENSGNLFYELNQMEQAKEQWKKSLELEPANSILRQRIEDHFKKVNNFIKKFATSEKEISKLIKLKIKKEDYPKASAVILLHEKISQIFDSGSSKDYVHVIVKILNSSKAGYWKEVAIPGGAGLKILNATTTKENGEVIEATDIDISSIAMPQIEDNCIIDLCYTKEYSSGSWLENEYENNEFFKFDDPVITKIFSVIVPKNKYFKYYVHDPNKLISLKTIKKDKNDIYIWQAHNIPQIYEEIIAPPYSELAPTIYISTIDSWEKIALWTKSLVKDQLKTNNEIDEKVKELIKNCKTKKDKIRAIYKFIVTQIKYVYNDKGIYGRKPDQCANIFSNKYGDCKDKATLMIAMLKKAGIKAYYAEILTKDKGPKFIEIPQYRTNHIITCIPMENDKYWFLDGTATYLSSQILPFSDQGVYAFILNDSKKGYKYIKTPISESNQDIITKITKLNLNEDLSIEANSLWTYSGIDASFKRNKYNIKGDQKETIGKLINRYAKGSIINSLKIDNIDDIEKDIKINVSFNANNYAIKKDDNISFKPLFSKSSMTYLCNKEKRYYDLLIPYKYEVHNKEEYKIPKGYTVNIPNNFKINNDFFEFSLKYEKTDNSVICSENIIFKSLRVPQKKYELFRNDSIKCDKEFEREILLKKVTK